jgi:CHAT domain-containing protein
MQFDPEGRLWVIATTDIHVLVGTHWSRFGPFQPAPDIKKNLFGALAIQSEPFEVFAFGPWGYPVRIGGNPDKWIVEREDRSFDSGQPWIVHRIIAHPHWGRLAATEQGLFRWSDQRWQPYTQIDPRLSWLLGDVAAGEGSDFWILSRSLWQVRFPSTEPRLIIESEPPQVALSTDIALKLRAEDVQGPPSLWEYHVKFDPPIAPYGLGESSQRSEYFLSDLHDGGKYRYSIELEDAFGNRSKRVERSFQIAIPWTQNPRKVAWAVVAASTALLLLLGLIITRRGPTGFLLRLLSGRTWQLMSTGVDLTIEIERNGNEGLSFRLQTPTRMTTVVPRVVQSLGPHDLTMLRDRSVAVAELAGRGAIATSSSLQSEIQLLGENIYQSLPDAVRFVYEQSSRNKLQLVLEDNLLDIFWELWLPANRQVVGITNAVARQVGSGEISYKTPKPARRLVAVVFAPGTSPGGTGAPLRQAAREVKCVRTRLRSWGAKVILLPADASKEAVLDAMTKCHIFHYVGHAEFDALQPQLSYLPLDGDRLTAEEMHNAFRASPTTMFLAFINGCGSAREHGWQAGRAVFGLASAFLRDSTFFIGAQWPVQDSFSWEFADLFYRNVFPTSGAIWWRWLRRRELAGISLAEALRQVRFAMSSREQTVNTWPAYVYYGDPSARIEWR